MKNVYEILIRLEVLRKEIEALGIVATLLGDPELPERKGPTPANPNDVDPIHFYRQ